MILSFNKKCVCMYTIFTAVQHKNLVVKYFKGLNLAVHNQSSRCFICQKCYPSSFAMQSSQCFSVKIYFGFLPPKSCAILYSDTFNSVDNCFSAVLWVMYDKVLSIRLLYVTKVAIRLFCVKFSWGDFFQGLKFPFTFKKSYKCNLQKILTPQELTLWQWYCSLFT